MHITIIAVADFPQGLATTQRLRLIGKALMVDGHEVTIGLLHGTRSVNDKSGVSAVGSEEGMTYKYLNGRADRPTGFFKTLIDTLKGMIGAGLYVLNKKLHGKIDVVILYTPNIIENAFVLLVAKILRIPLFIEICEIRCAEGNVGKQYKIRRAVMLGDRLLEHFAPALGDGLIVISENIMEFYKNKGAKPDRMMYLPALVDMAQQEGALQPVDLIRGKKYFLNSGSFEEKEGIYLVMDAFAMVSRSCDEILLVFTGNPPTDKKSQVEQKAGELGITDKLIFTGYLTRDELYWCYKHSVALLCCRRQSAFASYGFPTKLVEYLASGQPVIATDVGEVNRYLKDEVNAFIAQAESVDSIAQAMTRVLNMGVDANAIGQQGKKLAEQLFDYRSYTKALTRLLNVNKHPDN
jgi:glycosyltransferase involved in cell wall biosynthesis